MHFFYCFRVVNLYIAVSQDSNLTSAHVPWLVAFLYSLSFIPIARLSLSFRDLLVRAVVLPSANLSSSQFVLMGLPLQTLLEARRKHLNGMHFSETAVLPVDSQLQERFFQVQCWRPCNISQSSPMLSGRN